MPFRHWEEDLLSLDRCCGIASVITKPNNKGSLLMLHLTSRVSFWNADVSKLSEVTLSNLCILFLILTIFLVILLMV